MHDFIGTIFYFFRNAIPLALIGLAAGAVILVMLNLKCRREGKCFPKGQAVAFLLLLCYLGGLAAITLMNRMDSMRTGVQLLPFLAFWEAWNNFTLQIWLSLEKDLLLFCVYLWHFKKTVVVKSERKDFEGTLYYALEGINEI